MDTPKLNLYQKLLEIQKRVVGLGKDKKSFSFEYVTGAKVLEHIKPLMNEYGLLLKQEIVNFENTRQDYNTAKGAKSEILTKVVIRFTWVDCETGEKDVNEFGANGQNDWDKGIGSALTYAERYFLLKFFHIATDEDDIDNPELKKQAEIAAEKLLAGAIKEVKACADKECTVQVWNKYPQLKEVESFKSAVSEKGKSFTVAETKAPEQPEKEAEAIKEKVPVDRTYREDGKAVVNGKTYEEATPEEREAAKGAPDKITAPEPEIKPLPEGVEPMTEAQRKTINELIPKVPAAMAKKATAWLNSGNPITLQEAAEKILKLAEEKSKAKANAAA